MLPWTHRPSVKSIGWMVLQVCRRQSRIQTDRKGPFFLYSSMDGRLIQTQKEALYIVITSSGRWQKHRYLLDPLAPTGEGNYQHGPGLQNKLSKMHNREKAQLLVSLHPSQSSFKSSTGASERGRALSLYVICCRANNRTDPFLWGICFALVGGLSLTAARRNNFISRRH